MRHEWFIFRAVALTGRSYDTCRRGYYRMYHIAKLRGVDVENCFNEWKRRLVLRGRYVRLEQ